MAKRAYVKANEHNSQKKHNSSYFEEDADGFYVVVEPEVDSPPVFEMDLDRDSDGMPEYSGDEDPLYTSPASSEKDESSSSDHERSPEFYESPPSTYLGSPPPLDGKDCDIQDDHGTGDCATHRRSMPGFTMQSYPISNLFPEDCTMCIHSTDKICRFTMEGNPQLHLVFLDRRIPPVSPMISLFESTVYFDEVTKAHNIQRKRTQTGALLALLERPTWLEENCRTLVIATSEHHIIQCVDYLASRDWKSTYGTWEFAGVEDMWEQVVGHLRSWAGRGLGVEFWRVPKAESE